MSTLYRQYRPQSWNEVVGQNHIKLTLQKEIETGRLAQAFLFSGPRGIGKTTLARLLAKSLNCENRASGESEPCLKCVSCEEIAAGRSIDVLEIDAASHTGVDNVRENIIDSSRFLPVRSKNKIFIVDEVHMLSPGAFNALLKVLEEPPAHVVFVLATTELYKVPATIISRCQCFDFKKVPIEEMVKRLKKIAEAEKIKVAAKVLEEIAYRSEGCLRDAESLLGQVFSLGEKNITEKEARLVIPRSSFKEAAHLLDLIAKKDLKEGLTFLNQLMEDGLDLLRFADDLIELSRYLLLMKMSGHLGRISAALDEGLLKIVMRLAKEFSLAQILKIIETLFKQKNFLRSSPIPQLPLEIALAMLIEEETISENKTISFSRPVDSLKKELKTENQKVAPVTPTNESVENGSFPSLDIICQKWQDFLRKVQEYNHSLPFILKMGQPTAVEGATVKIGVKFSFHRDRLNEPKLRLLAEKALSEVLGCAAKIEAILWSGESIRESEKQENNELVQNIVQAFGGKVVE